MDDGLESFYAEWESVIDERGYDLPKKETKMKIEVKLAGDGKIPSRGRIDDAAVDLHSNEYVTILPGQRMLVGTGVFMAIPEGYFGLILGRSGNASKKGVCILGGVIDSGYRGEIKVIILNTGEVKVPFDVGDRIAQMVFLPVPNMEILEVNELSETSRGVHGFGSTGT